MKFGLKRRGNRLRTRVRWRSVQRIALGLLMLVLLGRLALLTYWSWDVLELAGPRRRLALAWGLGLIALGLLLRFFRFTYREQRTSKTK